jgi:glycosyltransferase involved in cell wall biosynthesis
MSSISVVINTKNSAETLARTLKSVSWADEIIVVDMKSSDDTKQVAKKFTNKVFDHPDVGYVEPARNMAVNKAKSDWILVIDADEEIPPSLKQKIKQLVTGDATADAYYLPRKNIIFGEWQRHAGWWPDYQLRLFKKGTVQWNDMIHQPPKLTGDSDSLAAREDLAILHHNYQTIEQFLARLNRYTTHEASSNPVQITNSEALVESFTNEFLSRLFANRGLEDGIHGVSVAFLQAFYEQAVFLKKWQAEQFPTRRKEQKATLKSLRKFQRELNYWIADWHIQHSSGIPKIWWQFRRKFQI